jgi:hypothetical protein
MRILNAAITSVRIISKPIHPIRHFCVDTREIDEYAIRAQTQKPLFIRTAEYFGNLQINMRKIEPLPQEIDQSKFDFELCTPAQSSKDHAIEDSKQKQQNF